MATPPSFTKVMDNAVTETWYAMMPDVIDNITDSIATLALLRERGRFKTQNGGQDITRTVRYALPSVSNVSKGDILPQGETQSKTAARWTWRYTAGHVQRSIFDDQINSGPDKVKDYVTDRIEELMLSLEDDFEEKLHAANASTYSAESGKAMQSLVDMIPSNANKSTGTYGGIDRSNSWWQAKYKAGTAPKEVNLLDDMKSLYNTIDSGGKGHPNYIVTDQTLFEVYENYALDASQIIKDEGTKLADLGFNVLRFKGQPMIYTTEAINATDMLMLNTDFIDVVYDPKMWFNLGPWKDVPLQGERIAHVINACNLISPQLRRHGRLEY